MAIAIRMLLVSMVLFPLIIGLLQTVPGDATVMPYKVIDVAESGCRMDVQVPLKTANCHELGLKSIPQDLPEDIQKLDMRENNIASLNGSSFQRYPLITFLDLSQNDIRVIESTTFHSLNDLDRLCISWNPHLVLPATGLLGWAGKLSYLDVSESGLKSLPGDILKWSTQLDEILLGKNVLTTINISLCGTVGTVDMHENHIEHLTKEAFAFTCHADKLYLTWNRIQLVDPNVIASLHVRSLVLGGYAMTLEVIRNIFIGISGSNIEDLAILNANLGNFSQDFFNPMREYTLSTLDFSENHIVLYSSVFSSLKRVYKLVLYQNYLRTIEPDFFDGMHQLNVLNLNWNRIGIINRNDLTWNINLTELHLSGNSLTKVSHSTFLGLENLRLLDLTENKALATLELASFSGLKRIQTIKLSHCNIVTFELVTPSLKSISLDNMGFPLFSMKPGTSFKHSRFLEHLGIRNSWLMFFNLWNRKRNVSLFDGLHNLTTLDLSNNPLYLPSAVNELPTGIFEPLCALKTLILQHCNISVIHPHAFNGLESLQVLNLKGNIIQQLHFDLLKGLTQIRSINLADNHLAYLDKEIFSNNQELTTLRLSNNKLTRLSQSTFKPFESSLSSIDLSMNPIGCDCDIRWLLHWLSRPIKLLNEHTTICSPASLVPLRGQPLINFDPSVLCGLNIDLIFWVSLAVICLVIIVVLGHHYRWQLRHSLFLLKLAALEYMQIHDAREHTDYEFDLNIIFYDDDEEWVREHLRFPLEERLPQFQRNVFGDGDLIPGMHYLEAVDYVVSRSYKTVVLLSRAAVRDRWFMLKFRTAMDHESDNQIEFVVMIFLEDIPDEELPFLARLYLSDGRPYLHWPEDVRGREYFLDELTKHLTINLRKNDLIPIAL